MHHHLSQRFNQWKQQRSRSWLAKRIPAASQLSLNRRNLFILPTRFGWLSLSSIGLLLLMGNNYQNNLITGFGVWLLSLWLLSLILCHQNLSGLHFSVQQSPIGQADQPLRLLLNLGESSNKRAEGLAATLPQWHTQQAYSYHDDVLAIDLKAPNRGCWPLPRVKIYSVYPWGFFRCWTHADFQSELLAYPVPLAGYPCPSLNSGEQSEGQAQSSSPQQDEFNGLQAYRNGERKSLVAWKSFAAGKGLQTKTFEAQHEANIQLSDHLLPQLAYEQRLAVLSHWCQLLSQQQQPFGLTIDGRRLSPAQGKQQLQCALRMLAEAPKK